MISKISYDTEVLLMLCVQYITFNSVNFVSEQSVMFNNGSLYAVVMLLDDGAPFIYESALGNNHKVKSMIIILLMAYYCSSTVPCSSVQ